MMDKDLKDINNETNEEDKNIQNEIEENNNLMKKTDEDFKRESQEIQDKKNENDDSKDVIEELKTDDTNKENLKLEKEEGIKKEQEIIVEDVKEEEVQEEVQEEEKEDTTEEEKEDITEEVKENKTEEVQEEVKENKAEEAQEEEKEDTTEKLKENITEELKEEENKEVVESTTEIKDESLSESEEEIINLETDEDKTGRFRWYAVRLISGHENKVKTYLDSQIKLERLEDKIRNVLIPLEKVFEVKSGKKKIKKKNFLPGYILVEADLDDKIRSFISQSPSIINMVGSKSIKGQRLEPIPLRGDEIKRINAILNEDNQSEKIDFQLSVGDPVKVTSGPFNNFNGNVLDINTEKMKVKVMVSIFGRKTPIELEFTQLEKQK